MDIVTLLLIAIGLAMDAFSVAISNGTTIKKLKFTDALKIGLFFGIFQFGMLYIGNVLGGAFAKYIIAVDHWIAFFLLAFIGGKMFYEAVWGEEEIENNKSLDFKTLTILAIATSIDSLAVGVSLATITKNIIFDATVVGIIAFMFSFAGVYIGNKCGNLFGRKAEIVGGIVLVGIGVKILIEHLFF